MRHLQFGRLDPGRRQHELPRGRPKRAWPAHEVPRVLAELRAQGQDVEPYRCRRCGWWHFGRDWAGRKPKTWHPADELDAIELGPRAHAQLRLENRDRPRRRRAHIERRWRGVAKRGGLVAA